MGDPNLLLSAKQLAGVNEKLKRAEESIGNLNSQIVAFLKERPEGGLSHDKQKAAKEFAEFYAKRVVPLRFGVIAGEVINHLRSCLDHIAWMLSSEAQRKDHPKWIGFPIIATNPPTKDEIASYNRQVKGILHSGALDLIKQLQPYNTPYLADDPLAILNGLNNEDKHHTLILITAPWKLTVTVPAVFRSIAIIGLDTEKKEWLDPAPATQPKLEFSPYIAFAQIGGWKGEAVIPVLTVLLNKVRDIVGRFSELTI
jgi:hypothetical protein